MSGKEREVAPGPCDAAVSTSPPEKRVQTPVLLPDPTRVASRESDKTHSENRAHRQNQAGNDPNIRVTDGEVGRV